HLQLVRRVGVRDVALDVLGPRVGGDGEEEEREDTSHELRPHQEVWVNRGGRPLRGVSLSGRIPPIRPTATFRFTMNERPRVGAVLPGCRSGNKPLVDHEPASWTHRIAPK